MRNRQHYADLDSPAYLLGVPTVLFVVEILFVLISIFAYRLNIIAVILCTLGFHGGMAALYRWLPDWFSALLFFFLMPSTKIFKKNVSSVPSKKELEPDC